MSKCIYFVEGPCEEQLLNALKESPSKITPGKVKTYNVVQNLIPKSQLLAITPGTTIVLVFDTDVENTATLKKNVELIGKYCSKVKIVYLAQVKNFEEELARCTDVRSAQELTQSKGVRNFKSDFCRLKVKDCRNMLDRHNLDVGRLWTAPTPAAFDFVEQNSQVIKN